MDYRCSIRKKMICSTFSSPTIKAEKSVSIDAWKRFLTSLFSRVSCTLFETLPLQSSLNHQIYLTTHILEYPPRDR